MIERRALASTYSFWGILAVLLVFTAIGFADLISDYLNGGRRWQQGDWLIHSLAGPVRRGILGTGLIYVSDTLAVNALAVTVAFQILVFTALMVVLFFIATAVMTHPSQIAALLLPPFYPVMMVSRFDGMIYKDVLAVLGLAILTLAVVRPGTARWMLLLGVITLILAFFAHEALIFFFPAGAFLIYLTGRNGTSLSLIAILGLAAAAAFVFAVLYSKADPVAICAELLDRGLNRMLCEGPVDWLNVSLGQAISTTFEKAQVLHLFQFFSVWLLSIMVLCYLLGQQMRSGLILGALTLLPFLLLFVVAFDFGRWFSFSFTSLVFILLATRVGREMPKRTFAALATVGASSILTYDPTSGVYLSGVVNRFVALLG